MTSDKKSVGGDINILMIKFFILIWFFLQKKKNQHCVTMRSIKSEGEKGGGQKENNETQQYDSCSK